MAFRSLMVNVSELDRLATEGAAVAQRETVLMKVTAAAAISGATSRWKYTVQPARVGAAPTYTPALEVAISADALSVSELSNDATRRLQLRRRSDEPTRHFRRGRRYPVGSYVFMRAVPRTADGDLHLWLIINTQAIDGECT
jgi:hypothetical protein